MIPELIIYNYCPDEISQDTALCYVEDLLKELDKQGINTSFLEKIDGNKDYHATYLLIEKILNYWDKLPTQSIHQSFFLLRASMQGEDIERYSFKYFCNNSKIHSELIDLTNSKIIPPAFFNAIIITGKKYKLEIPFGVASGEINEGGICINCNTSKESIWHETAHLLGADDHYGKTAYKCKNPTDCFMQYNATQGSCFCSESVKEIEKCLRKAR